MERRLAEHRGERCGRRGWRRRRVGLQRVRLRDLAGDARVAVDVSNRRPLDRNAGDREWTGVHLAAGWSSPFVHRARPRHGYAEMAIPNLFEFRLFWRFGGRVRGLSTQPGWLGVRARRVGRSAPLASECWRAASHEWRAR